MKLRIFLPASERPEPGERQAWMLFDARGELRREDHGTLDEMPRADQVEAVLPAERVLFARLKLPKVNAATIRELLPFAVEDRLLADPAHIHAVAGRKNAAGETVVAVVDRNWIEARLAALARSGHRATTAYCASALLAGGHGDWHVVWGRTRGMLVDDEGVAATFDRGSELPLALRLALDEASARGDKPTSVRVHYETGETLPDLARWNAETGIAFTPGVAWEELARDPLPAPALDLLQGDLSVRRESLRVPRAALYLAGVIVASQLGLSGYDAWRLGAERDRLQARREAIFRDAFPQAQAVVDPELQMTRNLEEMKRARGLAAGDDFLAQLTRVAREKPTTLRTVEYGAGRMVAK